jgi:hypothetical protein
MLDTLKNDANNTDVPDTHTELTPEQLRLLAGEILKQLQPGSPGIPNLEKEGVSSAPESQSVPVRLTGDQRVRNKEIQRARQKLAEIPPAEVLASVCPLLKTGDENPEYDHHLRVRLSLALSRMAGEDSAWDAYWQPAEVRHD